MLGCRVRATSPGLMLTSHFASGEGTLPSPLFKPGAPLEPKQRGCRCTATALLVLCFLRSLESRLRKLWCSLKPGRKPQDGPPGPTPLLGWGPLSQLPFHLAPVGGFGGSSCGAEKGENWAQRIPVQSMPGKQREVGGLGTGSGVPLERHCGS